MSAGAEVVGALTWEERVGHLADRGLEAIDGAFGGLAERGLQLDEGFFAGIEVRTVGWQEQQARTGGFDQQACSRPLVAEQVVYDDDVAGAQLWGEHRLDVGLEGAAVDGATQHERRYHAAHGQGADEGGVFHWPCGKPMGRRSPLGPRPWCGQCWSSSRSRR